MCKLVLQRERCHGEGRGRGRKRERESGEGGQERVSENERKGEEREREREREIEVYVVEQGKLTPITSLSHAKTSVNAHPHLIQIKQLIWSTNSLIRLAMIWWRRERRMRAEIVS